MKQFCVAVVVGLLTVSAFAEDITLPGTCSESVIKTGAAKLGLDSLKKRGTDVVRCEPKDLKRTDPANTGNTHYYFADVPCYAENSTDRKGHLHVFEVTQGESTCSIKDADAPTAETPPVAPSAWTIDQFITELEDDRYATIEDALKSLPESARSRFTYLHTGHGLRGTSYKRPGVILFADSGEYAITFGDESKALGNELEIFRFDAKANQGELVRAAFPPENVQPRSGRIVVQKNPPQCVRCHLADPMMRWGTYAKWPGAYGSKDDMISLDAKDSESLAFFKFAKEQPTLPRYRTLIPPVGETGILPFWDNSPVSPYTALPKDTRVNLRPNSRINFQTSAVNGRRLARKILASPHYKAVRPQLLVAMMGCNPNYSELATALARVGVQQKEIQPNILEPLDPEKLPPFSDGFSGPTKNGVINYAVGMIYKDIVKEYPKFAGSFVEQSAADALSPGYWFFGGYPATRRILTDVGNLGSFFGSDGYDTDADFCKKVKEIAAAVTVP